MKQSFWWVVLAVIVVALALANHFKPPAIPLAGAPGIAAQQPIEPSDAEVRLQRLHIDGDGDAISAVVGNGGSVALVADYEVDAVTSAHPRIAVRLERSIGSGAWTTTGDTVTLRSGDRMTMTTPAYSAAGRSEAVQYRFGAGTAVSDTISVVYENQRYYTGMAAEIYRYAAPYCPNTAVHIADLSGREAGEFITGSLLILIDPAIGVTANRMEVDQRALAIHECSHELQWVDYGRTSDGFHRMEQAAAKYFSAGRNGAAPLEHAADCGAKSVNPGGYLGYGGYCTVRELEEGRRLLTGLQY